jgi:hypothetical protein
MSDVGSSSTRAQTLVRVGVICALLGAAAVAVIQAQGAAARTLAERAGPYLDAIVAGDHALAASLDHPQRPVDPEALQAAYAGREAALGQPTAWSIVVANAGRDPDGELVLGTVHLTHSGREAPVTLRVELRDDGGIEKVRVLAPSSRALGEATLW